MSNGRRGQAQILFDPRIIITLVVVIMIFIFGLGLIVKLLFLNIFHFAALCIALFAIYQLIITKRMNAVFWILIAALVAAPYVVGAVKNITLAATLGITG